MGAVHRGEENGNRPPVTLLPHSSPSPSQVTALCLWLCNLSIVWGICRFKIPSTFILRTLSALFFPVLSADSLLGTPDSPWLLKCHCDLDLHVHIAGPHTSMSVPNPGV